MNKKLIAIGIVLVFLVVGLSGCQDIGNNNPEKNKFIGTWEPANVNHPTLICYSDGTGSLGNSQMDWELKDEKFLVKNLFQGHTTFTYEYGFSDDNNTLSLKDLNTNVISDYKRI